MRRLTLVLLLLALPLAADVVVAPFPQGIAAGDVQGDSVVLWARSSTPGDVRFVVVARGTWPPFVRAATASVTDANVPAKVDITGLRSGTEYVYLVGAPGGPLRETGHFRTPFDAGTKHGLHFGVSGDWRGELAPYPSVANAAAKNLDFFVEFGDTIYADFPSPAVNKPQATTIAEYRAKHAEVYTEKDGMDTLADIRRNTAIFATIDDHEVTDNFAGGAPASSDPRFGTTTGTINQTTLFNTGLQAFEEYEPIRSERYAGGLPKLYRYRTFGGDAAMFLLDERTFRDQELQAPNLLSTADVTRFLLQSFDIDPSTGKPAATQRTMLGAQQLADLKHDLLDAQQRGITWKFVLVPEPMQNLGPYDAQDRYEGYARERTDLLGYIETNKIRNVVFVTADLHGTLVNNVTFQQFPGGPQIPTGTFEIITGPVAYDAPLGPTVVNIGAQLGIVTKEQKALYDSLPTIGKDQFFKTFVNGVLAQFGYDPIGLEGSPIPATLVAGDYVSAHTYGWTEFTIDPASQKLDITTWGIPAYTEQGIDTNPAQILSFVPQIVSRFTVTPQ